MSNIALQIERLTGGSVATTDAVIFDNVLFSSGDISFSPLTGVIAITRREDM